MQLNRAQRRKTATKVANDVIKGKIADTKKRQFGIGLILTNLMLVVMLGPWTVTLFDRRHPDAPSAWRALSFAVRWRWVRLKMRAGKWIPNLLIRWRGHRV